MQATHHNNKIKDFLELKGMNNKKHKNSTTFIFKSRNPDNGISNKSKFDLKFKNFNIPF